MTETERDFDRELDRAADSLRRLALEVERLVDLGARGYGSGQDGFAAFLAALQAELDTAVSLFRVCQKERARVDAGMTVAAQTLQQLLDQLAAVQRIEEDIRLVSLNTAFLCQRIGGKGRVLAVIAQELRSRASRMLEDCRGLFSLVDEIGDVARRFEQIRDGHGAQRMAAMEQTINASLQPLRRGGTDIALALARLGSEGSAAGQTLRGSVATLAGLDDLGCTLRALCRRLHRLAGDVPAHVNRGLLRERLRLFPVCYTMASERAVHAAICGVEAAEAPALLADPASDVLF